MHAKPTFHTMHRVSWIDICRGIGIILVIYGHLFVSTKNNYLIFAFHMPLFFFISGLVFTPSTKPLWEITKKYFKQLLIPYYIFAVLTYAFTLISQTAGDVSIGGIAYQLFGILYGSGSDGMLGYNVVLWFLPCLFITKLAFAAITKKTSRTRVLAFILLVSASGGYLLSTYAQWIKLPFGIEIALTGLPFLGVGYLAQRSKHVFAIFSKQKGLLTIATLLFTACIATINYNTSGAKVDLRSNTLDNFFLFYLGAFGGIVSWVTISQIIAKNAVLEYIGRHSITIFAWHNVLSVDLHNIINSILDPNFLDTIRVLMPTFYAVVIINIILFSRLIVVKLRGVYNLTNYLKL